MCKFVVENTWDFQQLVFLIIIMSVDMLVLINKIIFLKAVVKFVCCLNI